jgi:hypothetical protein
MPDEMMAGYLIDPSLITETRRFCVDVDTTVGMNYGSSQYWDEVAKGYAGVPWPDQPAPKRQKPLPPPGARIADVGWEIGKTRFQALFLDLMTRAMPEQ